MVHLGLVAAIRMEVMATTATTEALVAQAQPAVKVLTAGQVVLSSWKSQKETSIAILLTPEAALEVQADKEGWAGSEGIPATVDMAVQVQPVLALKADRAVE